MTDENLPGRKISIDELKKFPGFELLENIEAQVIINKIHGLSLLFYESYESNNYND